MLCNKISGKLKLNSLISNPSLHNIQAADRQNSVLHENQDVEMMRQKKRKEDKIKPSRRYAGVCLLYEMTQRWCFLK